MDSIRKKIINAIQDSGLLKTLQEISSEKTINVSDLSQLLADLHNDRLIDFLAFIDQVDNDANRELSSIKSILENTLPLLDVPITRVLVSIELLEEKNANHFSAIDLYEPFIKFCALDNGRYKTLLDIIFHNLDSKVKYLNVALISWSRNNLDEAVAECYRLLSNNNQTVRIKAISSLGLFNYHGSEQAIPNIFSTLKKTVVEDELEKAELTWSLYCLLKLDPSLEDYFIDFLRENVDEGDDQILHQLSIILMLDVESVSSKLRGATLEKLKSINCSNTGSINNLDLALSKMVKHDYLDEALNFIEHLLISNRSKIEVTIFDSFIHSIKKSDEILSHVITRWLNSKRVYFGRVALELMDRDSDGSGRLLMAELSQLDTNIQRIFVGRKACGWLYTSPLSAVSFIFSLMSGAEAEAKQHLTNLCFNPLLISYPGSVKTYLEGLRETGSEVAESLLTRLNDYHKGLSSSNDIKELEVPMSYREIYHRKMSEAMAKSYDKAREGSLMSLLGVKTTSVLYGTGSIFYIERGDETGPSRQETMMHAISTSIEYPALENVDPHGLNKMVECFRLEGCKV